MFQIVFLVWVSLNQQKWVILAERRGFLGENSPALGPGDVLALAGRIAADAIIFFLNPQRLWEQADVVQGIWNLRDVFKAGGQMLVLVMPPGVRGRRRIRSKRYAVRLRGGSSARRNQAYSRPSLVKQPSPPESGHSATQTRSKMP